MGPGLRRDDVSVWAAPLPALGRHENVMRLYASPAVSNIDAAIASVADLPAHTTNWNAG